MKQPKLNNLTIDLEGTRKLQSQLSKAKTIKITINIDDQSLMALRKASGQSTPLRFLYRAIKDEATSMGETKARLDRIERELQKLKRQIAA